MALELDISKIRSVKGSRETFQMEEAELDFLTSDWKLARPLVIVGEMDHADKLIDLNGTVETVVEGRCARCLAPVVIPVKCSFAEQLLYTKDVALFSHLAFGELEEKYVIYDNDTLDITDIIRETIMAELPLKVLCRDDCRGLCPKCGINLNQGQCKCDLQEVDPRFAILAKLIESEEV